MANGAFKFKDNSGNVVSHISGSGRDILFSGGTLDLSGMTGLTLGNLTLSGTTQNAQTASFAPSYLLTSSFNTYSSSLATTGSNLFKGNQTISGSIIPAVDNTYDLGSLTNQFRDLYLSSASLYIDGTKVLGSTAQELQITTDTGQSFKILEASSDTITLQSADGNITLATSGGGDVIMDPTTGVIALKGTTTLYAGNKIVSSDGNSIQFGNGIAITGSIVSTVTPLVSGSSQIIYSGLTGIPSGIVSGSEQLTSSYDGRYVLSGSITQTTWDNIASKPSGIASGSSQIDITGTTGYSTFSSSISTSIGSLSSSVATTTSGLSSSIGSLSSSVATTTLGTKNRVDSIESKTGSYATTGSNIFQGDQTITGSLYVSQNLIIAGSSSIQNISSSIVNISDNIITVNALNPSVRFGGLAVIDSGSSPQVSGSMLFDSVNNQWLFVHQNQASVTSSVLLMGPETYNNLGNESYITANRLVKSTGIEHLTNSNISDDGTTVTMLSNTEVTGTLKVTSTITGTLSGNASTATSSSYATTAGSAGSSTSSTTAATASYILGSNVSGNISGNAATATSSSYATTSTSSSYSTTAGSAGSATSATTAATASYVLGSNVSGNISGNAGTATSATTAATASYVLGSNVSGNISGNATTVTNGVYTTGDQSIAGTKTFTGTINVTASEGREITTFMPSSYTTDDLVSGHEYGWYNDHWRLGMTRTGGAAGGDFVIQWNAARRLSLTSGGNLSVTGTISATNFSGSSSGTNTGDQTSVSGNAGTVTNGVYTTGDQTIGGAKTFSSRVSVNGTLAVNTSNDSSTSTGGITFWDAGNTTTSWIGFKNASNSGWGTHGGASATYHTYFVMDTASRGWIFRYASPGGTDFSGTNVASISNTGRFAANNGYQFTFNGTNRGGIYAKTTWFGTGSDYSPSICAEGGLNFNVYVDGSTTKGTTIDTSGHLYPVGNGTQNLGGSSNRWATVFTSDLSLNNGIGDYTIVEGEEKLYLYNNKNNKVYSFVLQEEDPTTATPKKS